MEFVERQPKRVRWIVEVADVHEDDKTREKKRICESSRELGNAIFWVDFSKLSSIGSIEQTARWVVYILMDFHGLNNVLMIQCKHHFGSSRCSINLVWGLQISFACYIRHWFLNPLLKDVTEISLPKIASHLKVHCILGQYLLFEKEMKVATRIGMECLKKWTSKSACSYHFFGCNSGIA